VNIVLPKILYLQMVVEAERMAPRETGGIFLGWQQSAKRPFIEITHMIGPGPRADHEYKSFEPDYKFQSTETDRIFQLAPKGITYLGDWHTHPTGTAKLSWQDRTCLHKIARSPVSRNPTPIMVVLSGLDNWQPRAWKYRPVFPRLGWSCSAEMLVVKG